MALPWNPADYDFVDVKATRHGGAASCAVHNSSFDLDFRLSGDGTTWTLAPSTVTTLSGGAWFNVVVNEVTGAYVVTDGKSAAWSSVDGVHWTSF